MSLKVNENLYIATNELKHLISEPTDNGWKKALVEQMKDYGLFYSGDGSNGKIVKIDNTSVYIDSVAGVSVVGDVFALRNRIDVPIPVANTYYWIYAIPSKSQAEKGTLSINSAGEIFGSSTTEFLSKLRGGDLPTRIEFTNSALNTGQYDVVSVSSDTVAVLNGAAFVAESNLKYRVIGTYDELVNTIGFDAEYEYDDCEIDVILTAGISILPSTPPSNSILLGVAYNVSGELLIQDRRNNWFTTENKVKNSVTGAAHIAGVESVKWDVVRSPGNENIATISWALRSTNWSINYNDNTIVVSGASGGIINDANFTAFYEGFVGNRVYNAQGSYAKVINSSVSGGTIRLQMTSLPTNLFVVGTQILVTPDFDFIQIQSKDLFTGGASVTEVEDTFAINTAYVDFRLPVKGSTWEYKIKYTLIQDGVYTPYQFLPVNELGFIKESSYDGDYAITTLTRQPYGLGSGIVLTESPNSYKTTIDYITTGERYGVGRREIIAGSNTYNYMVGTDYKNQILYTTTQVNFGTNYFINLATTVSDGVTAPKNGVEFIFDVRGDYVLNSYKIIFNQGPTSVPVFELDKFYAAQAKDETFRVRFVFDGTNWIYQEHNSFSKKKFDQTVQRFYPPSFLLGPSEVVTSSQGVITDLNNARITGSVFAWGGTTANMPTVLGLETSGYVECVFSPNLEGVQTIWFQPVSPETDASVWKRFYRNDGGGVFYWTPWINIYQPEPVWIGASDASGSTIRFINGASFTNPGTNPGFSTANNSDSLRFKRKSDGTIVFEGGFFVVPTGSGDEYVAMLDFTDASAEKYRPCAANQNYSLSTFNVGVAKVGIDTGNFFFVFPNGNPNEYDDLAKRVVAYYVHSEKKMYFRVLETTGVLEGPNDRIFFNLTGLSYQGS